MKKTVLRIVVATILFVACGSVATFDGGGPAPMCPPNQTCGM